MAEHHRVVSTHPVSRDRTEFVLWYDTPDVDYVGRCVLNVNTGVAGLHIYPTAGECRALAGHLLLMADAIEGITTTEGA